MEEQSKALINEINKLLNQIFRDELSLLNISAEDLIRTDELGKELDFSNAKKTINQIIAMFKDVNEFNLEEMPIKVLTYIRDRCKMAFQIFSDILNFKPTGQNPAEVRDDIIKKMENHYADFYSLFAQYISYQYLKKDIKLESINKEAETALSRLKEMEKGYEEYHEQKAKESDAIIDKMREASAEVGVSQHAMHFKEEAKEYKIRSYIWLGITTLIALAILLFAYNSFQSYINLKPEDFKNFSTAQLIQIGIAKLIIFSILYFAVIWSGKFCKAQWHNYVVNKHRQNALSTFGTFTEAPSDEQTKNAVLLQTTQCIFSQQSSGFINQERESTPSPAVFEIIKNIIQEQK